MINANCSLVDRSQRLTVHPSRQAIANAIDANHDQLLSDDELLAFVDSPEQGCHGSTKAQVDHDQLLAELKNSLLKRPSPEKIAYHSYDAVTKDLEQLEQQHPDLCQRVSLGKTAEGRDIWALRISENVQAEETSQKTGIVITGCHHSREWMSVEIPLHVAKELVNKYGSDDAVTKRLQQGEIWIVPCLNPDGYEYSRNEDNWWRKNRAPVGTDATGQQTSAVGTDVNRNYWDGREETFKLYRPDGDTAESTSDDFSSTSDSPSSDTYRGRNGGSEIETQAIMKLELGHKNIRGVIDHHSYGNLVLYPWGSTQDECRDVNMFKEIGNKINGAMNNSFSVEQSSELYPAAGESDDCQYVNGIVPFTLEVGRSFQPPAATIKSTCEKVGRGNMVFIDEILQRAAAGTLLERV